MSTTRSSAGAVRPAGALFFSAIVLAICWGLACTAPAYADEPALQAANADVLGTQDVLAGQEDAAPVSLSDCTVTFASCTYQGKNTSFDSGITVTDKSGKVIPQEGNYTAQYYYQTDKLVTTLQEAGSYRVSIQALSSSTLCTGATSATFTISPLDIRTCTVTLEKDSYVYQGSSSNIRPDFTLITPDGTKLTQKDQANNYNITYNANQSVGTGSEVITGTKNFTNSITKTFTINALDLKECTATATDVVYRGSSCGAYSTLTLRHPDGTVVPSYYYTREYTNDVEVGTATMTIKPATNYSNNYTGSTTATFKVTPVNLTTGGSISYISPLTFTGEELKPDVTLACSGVSGNVDKSNYTVSYTDNVNAGTATVTVTGKNNCTGTATRTFTISPLALTNATVAKVKDKIYTGKEITPKPKVTLNGKLLKLNTDYTLTYYNNTNVGSGSVYISGKGNYSSMATQTFNIVGRPMKKAKVSSVKPQTFTNAAISPEITVTYDGKTLASGTDYTVSYENNINPGKATITITGAGTYAGTKKTTFKIKKTGTIPKVTAVQAGSGKINLSWNPIYKATRYAVAEKMPDGAYKYYTYNCMTPYGSISPLSATRSHQFLVQAFVDGKWSSKDDKYLATIKPSGPVKPSVRAIAETETSVTLSWEDVPGADHYSIATLLDDGTWYTNTDTYAGTTATLNQLEKKKTYTYLVRAFIEDKWSKYTKADYVKISPADPNPPTVTAKATKVKGQMALTWNNVRGASKYSVEMKLPNGKWKKYTSSLKDTAYTISGLSATQHVFRVRAYGNKKWSKLYASDQVTGTPSGPAKPEAKVVAKKTTKDSVKLKWGAVPAAKKYSVAVKVGKNKYNILTTNVKKTSYTVKKLQAAKGYKFLVRAYVDGKWTPYKKTDLVKAKTLAK